MGGKTATSTQAVSVPPQVLAQYQSVNDRANATASTPFQEYGGEFVAPVNAQQSAGIAGTNAAANEAQPYYGAATNVLGGAQADTVGTNNLATGLAAASAGAVNPTTLDANSINQYMSPYLSDVVNSESQLLNQNNQQAQAGQLGTAISSGAFGGDRSGIAAANLAQQNTLANSNIYANLLNTGYNNALSTAQQQQGVGLAAGQANRAALGSAAQTLAGVGQTAYGEGANTASELGALGSGAQSAGLAGSAAQIQAGTVQQQTQQAQDTAQYQQFLQEQSYPFQVDQFLANIAEGTGALSGSTTTTTQPGGFFSDRRLKYDIKKIGKTFDGQTLYSYKMHGDDRTHIGLIAQDVEKKHPDAVGLAGGFKMVDYGRATEKAANRGHFETGGVVPIRRHRDAGGGLSDVLNAQQEMYGRMGGVAGNKREISQPGTSHQLAVASGSPPPANNGASQVQTGIGLGKDAYKAYKYFNQPQAGNGSAPDIQADTELQNSYLNSGVSGDGASAPMSDDELANAYLNMGQSANAAPVASDAAASAAPAAADSAAATGAESAAASGAGAAAGDAAATTAATTAAGAAAGAVTDAAAEEAAALAAEYAAADVAIAAVAARRGGRIKRDLGGGTPYGSDSELAIPEDQNQYQMQKPGPLTKQKTGLQTLQYMGQPDNAMSIGGDMFSNEPLARGGVAGGRKGYDDGGAPDNTTEDDLAGSDPDAAPTPVAQADDQPTGVAAGSKKEGFFEKLKKPENYLPILKGLAAMGTAKTVHPGVALAAGLGAGADEYLESRKSLADTANVQTEAQGRDIQNQINQLGLDEARKAFTPSGSGSRNIMPRQQSSVSSDETDPQTLAFSQFAPLPTARPDSVTNKMTAFALAKNPEAAKAWGEQYDQEITNQNQTRALGANAAYLNAAKIATAPPGQAFALMAKQNPKKAAALQQQGLAPDQLDTQARTWASEMGFAAHQWSNRPSSMVNGVLIDQQTNSPVIGSSQIMAGLSPAEKQAAYENAMTPVTLNNGLPGRNYQLAGFSTPEQYILAQDKASRLSGAQPTAGTGPTPNVQPTAPPTSAPVRPPRTAPPQPATVPTAAHTGDAYLDKSLSDPAYRLKPLPPVVDQLSRKAAEDQQNLNISNRQKLSTDSDQITEAASTAKQYMIAAKQIMDSKGAPVTGLYGPAAYALSRAFSGIDSTNYQEAAKYLGNAAAQSAKANFPNATQSEMGMQFNELSPNLAHNDDAIKDLLNTNIRGVNYVLDTANRAKRYVDAGNDPTNFGKWNQNNFKREVIVNATQSATGPGGQRIYKLGGRWVMPNGQPYQAGQ